MSEPAWKRLSSGRYIDLANLTEDDVHIEDIETPLNNIKRFTGHYKDRPPLTVAQHSLLCLNLALEDDPENHELHLRVFTHDFAEAYIGDVATPVKKVMGKFWYDFARPIEHTVEKKMVGSLPTPDMKDAVKFYDAFALDIERRSLWEDQRGKDKWPPFNEISKSLRWKKVQFMVASLSGEIDIEKIYKDLKEKYDFSLQT